MHSPIDFDPSSYILLQMSPGKSFQNASFFSFQLLIGFESGAIVLWDLKNKTAEARFNSSEVRNNNLSPLQQVLIRFEYLGVLNFDAIKRCLVGGGREYRKLSVYRLYPTLRFYCHIFMFTNQSLIMKVKW